MRQILHPHPHPSRQSPSWQIVLRSLLTHCVAGLHFVKVGKWKPIRNVRFASDPNMKMILLCFPPPLLSMAFGLYFNGSWKYPWVKLTIEPVYLYMNISFQHLNAWVLLYSPNGIMLTATQRSWLGGAKWWLSASYWDKRPHLSHSKAVEKNSSNPRYHLDGNKVLFVEVKSEYQIKFRLQPCVCDMWANLRLVGTHNGECCHSTQHVDIYKFSFSSNVKNGAKNKAESKFNSI